MSDEFFATNEPMSDASDELSSQPPPCDMRTSSVSDMPDRANQAILALKARIAQRANMDDRLMEVEQSLSNIQRQSMNLQSGQGDIEKIKDFCRKQVQTNEQLKKSIAALEQVCKHLMDAQTDAQHQTDLINQALIRLGDD